MMKPFAYWEQSLRFSEAAVAAGVDPTNLRNWLKRNDVRLCSPEPERGHRRFIASDVALLAIMKPLIDYGLSVQEANRLAEGIMAHPEAAWKNLYSADGGELCFNGDLAVLLWSNNSNWQFTVFSLSGDSPWHLAPCPIVIQIGRIIGEAFQRMTELPASTVKSAASTATAV